jgi:hypothetical protein
MSALASTSGGQIITSSYYDSASISRTREFGYTAPFTHEDMLFTTDVRWVAIARLRKEFRNNPFIAALVMGLPDLLGYSTLRSRSGDHTWDMMLDAVWAEWAKASDINGQSLRTTERIRVQEHLMTGEMFYLKFANGHYKSVPSEFVGSPLGGNPASGELNGIIYDADGKKTGYRIGRQLVSGMIDYAAGQVIPAEMVIHDVRPDRVCQGRGLPWLNPVLTYARDLYAMDMGKTAQLIAANFTGGVIKMLPENAGKVPFGANLVAGNGLSTPSTPEAALAAQQKQQKKKVNLEHNTLVRLEVGEDFEPYIPVYQTTEHAESLVLKLNTISAVIGCPRQLWWGGTEDSTFSGYKGIGTQWQGRRASLLDFATESFLEPLSLWRIQKFIDEGDLPPRPENAKSKIEYAFGATAVLDEQRDAQAAADRMACGLTDLEEEWRRVGKFPEEVFVARKALWIRMLIVGGQLEEGGDYSKLQVPLEWLRYCKLPGEVAAGKAAPQKADPADSAAAKEDAAAEMDMLRNQLRKAA